MPGRGKLPHWDVMSSFRGGLVVNTIKYNIAVAKTIPSLYPSFVDSVTIGAGWAPENPPHPAPLVGW
jgi:hypothetical protein